MNKQFAVTYHLSAKVRKYLNATGLENHLISSKKCSSSSTRFTVRNLLNEDYPNVAATGSCGPGRAAAPRLRPAAPPRVLLPRRVDPLPEAARHHLGHHGGAGHPGHPDRRDRRGRGATHGARHPQRAELARRRRAAVGRAPLPTERRLHPGRRPDRAHGRPGQELRGPAAAQLPGRLQPRDARRCVVVRQAVRRRHARQPRLRGAGRLRLSRRPGRREGGARVLPLGALRPGLLRRRLPHAVRPGAVPARVRRRVLAAAPARAVGAAAGGLVDRPVTHRGPHAPPRRRPGRRHPRHHLCLPAGVPGQRHVQGGEALRRAARRARRHQDLRAAQLRLGATCSVEQ